MSAIFSVLPVSIDTLCSGEDLRRVKEYFSSREGVWVRADVVACDLGWPVQRTAERVRRAVAELVEVGVPIVHSQQGFMLAVDSVAVYVAMRDLEARARGMGRKRAGYARIAQAMESRQSVLFSFQKSVQEESV